MLIEAGVVTAVTGVIGAVYRWKREKIRADRDQAMWDRALDGVTPADHDKVIESMAKTKHFCPTALPWRNRSKSQVS
jgi:hypothetical protein